MKHIFTKTNLVAMAVALLASVQLNAQNVIWSENFGGGAIPATWTNADASNQLPNPWTWSTAGPYFGAQPQFAAATAANGFALFNSDGAGQLPQNHDVRLTTSAINCAALTTVVVRFSNQYAFYSTGGVSQPQLGVSTNGTTFTYYPILASIPRNDLTSPLDIEEVDISTQAAGQNTVYLQFRWVGNYEYSWRIDDIQVQDGLTPPPGNNTAITYVLLPNSHQTPVTQVDTLFFEGDVSNLGSLAQSNVALTAEVENSTGSVLFSETATINTLPIGYSDSVFTFNNFLAPPLAKGDYTLTYDLTSDSTDLDPLDNTEVFDFIISDSTFANDNGNFIGGFAAGNGTAGAGSYAVGNYYYVPNAGDRATSVTFAISNPDDIPGETVDLFLYLLDENGDGDLDENGDNAFDSNDLLNSIKGFGQYTFTGNEPAGGGITVSLDNFNAAGQDIALQADGNYLIVLQYNGNNAMYFVGAEAIDYTNLNTIAVDTDTDTWYLGGFSSGIIAVVRLNASMIPTSTTPAELEETAVKVFPNPAKEFVNLSLNLTQTSKNVEITIVDAMGKIIKQENRSNLQNETITFGTKDLAAGTYYLNVKTDEGIKSKRFIVVK